MKRVVPPAALETLARALAETLRRLRDEEERRDAVRQPTAPASTLRAPGERPWG